VRKRIVVLAACVCMLTLVASVGMAGTVSWKGVTWDTYGNGTVSVDGSNHLLLGPSDASEMGVHVNRLPDVNGGPAINGSGTPWIQFSYYDNGDSGDIIEAVIQDETMTQQPLLSAGSKWSATKVVGAHYYDPALQEAYLFFSSWETGTEVPDRANVLHTVLLGEEADGTIWAVFDGVWRSSTLMKDGIGPFDFNDVYLRVRNGESGDTIVFTDFQFGDDFQPIPEPISMIFFGTGVVGVFGYVARRRMRSRD